MLLNSQQQNNNNVVGSSSNKTNVIKKAVLIPVNTGQAQAPPIQQSQVNTMQMIPSSSSSTAHQMVVGDKKPSNERLQNPTIRFELSLEKPTSDEFNEFNYNKLALKALKQLKKKSDKLKRASNPSEFVNLTKNDFSRLDGSGELRVERANVSRLLLVYRKKLILSKKLDSVDDGLNESSTMPPDVDVDDENNSDSEMSSGLDNENFNSKKKYKDYEMEMCKYRLKNFTHLGKGYDESDSFIDNSDAYDANIPKNMVPTRGGFYINGETIQLREKKSSNKKKTTTTTKPVDKPKQPKKEEVKTGGGGEEDDDDDESDSTFTGSGSSSDESGSSSSGSTGSSDDDDSDSSDDDSDSSTLSTSDSSSSESQESIIVISEGQNNNQPPPQPQQPTTAVVKKPKILKLTINDDDDEDEENEAAKKAVDKENEKTQVVAENHTNDPSSLVDNKKKRKITESTIIVETMTQSIKPSSLSPSENLVPKKKKLETSATSSTTTTTAVNPTVPKQQQPQPHQQHVRTKTGEEKPVTQPQRPNINKPADNRPQVIASPTTTPNKPSTVATNSAQKPTTSGASPKSIELTPEMREKVAHLKSEFVLYRQQQLAQKQSGVTADIMAARFLDLPTSSATIYSLEGLIRRHQPHTARLKDLLVSQLIDALELARAQPQREMLLRKYQTIVANTRMRNLENSLRAKMDELRKLVNDEMPKNIEKYSKAMDEYKKQKESMPTSTENERTTTLKNAPRRRFEMSDRLRQMIVGIIQTKMAIYKPPPTPPQSQSQPQLAELQQQQKLEYIQQFFDAELIPIWPKNWMQRNVLLNIYTLKYLPQQQKNPAANTSFENPSPSPLKTTTPTTNLSSPSVSISQQHQHVSSARQTPTTSLSTGAHSVSVSSPLSQPSKIQASASVPHHLTNQAETLNISSKSGKTVQMERIQSHQTLHSPQFMYAKEHQPKQEIAASSSNSSIDYSMNKKQPAPQIQQQAVNQTRPTTTTMTNEGTTKISYQTPPQTVTPKNQNQNYQAASSTSSSPASSNFFISPAQIESLIRTNKEFSNLIDLTALQPLLNSHFNANANPAALSNKSNQTKNNS